MAVPTPSQVERSWTESPPGLSPSMSPVKKSTLTKSRGLFGKSRARDHDHAIGAGATFQGRLEFNGLLRVDGRFEGVLKPAGNASIIVTRSGMVMGDLETFNNVTVDGTVLGSIIAHSVHLRRHSFVEGHITCKELSAAPGAVYRGKTVGIDNSCLVKEPLVTPLTANPSSGDEAFAFPMGALPDVAGLAISSAASSAAVSAISIVIGAAAVKPKLDTPPPPGSARANANTSANTSANPSVGNGEGKGGMIPPLRPAGSFAGSASYVRHKAEA
ncbi:unnamed protein product, partial [Discosporangium mesarthrocarpum]